MRFIRLICLCLLCPLFALAQTGVITGKVVRIQSKTPVPNASVFLSNSSFGTATAENGTFTLSGLRPGQYTLVVTIIGYEDHTQTVLVGKDPINLTIELATKSIELREVQINTNAKADFKRNFDQFFKEFIGTDANAKNCVVINPEILNFTYHKAQKVLEAYADDFLIVENRGLGYRLKYLVKDFKSDGINHIISYGGQHLFEELPAKGAQLQKWHDARDVAYYGSPMQFYRSLYKDRLAEDGFEIHRLSRMLNPNRPREEVIIRNIERFESMRKADSANYWIGVENLSKYYNQVLTDQQWMVSEVLRQTETPGIYALTFPDCLYVIYTKKREETYMRDIYRPLTMPNYEISIVSFPGKGPNVAFFDMNGIVIGGGTLYEGTWSKARVSQLLPVDFVPYAEFGASAPVTAEKKK